MTFDSLAKIFGLILRHFNGDGQELIAINIFLVLQPHLVIVLCIFFFDLLEIQADLLGGGDPVAEETLIIRPGPHKNRNSKIK